MKIIYILTTRGGRKIKTSNDYRTVWDYYWRNESEGAILWECSQGRAVRSAGF